MDVKNFILNSDKPVVIRDCISDWKLLNYSEKDWCDAFKHELLTFRKGDKNDRKNPYWEQLCGKDYMTLEKFFEVSKEENENWWYYDYKYMKHEYAIERYVIQKIKWDSLGFGNLSGEDSVIWIGNKGAHTPCHMDTYGFNLVSQIYGRKLWILIPPEETESLKPTRVPYEESSIYSSYNFYTPNSDLLSIKKAYGVILNPGEVLYVPRHWWHYVENLETSISINIWVPLKEDDESRLEEILVRNYILNLCQELTKEEATTLLNPNEHNLLHETFDDTVIALMIENCKKYRKQKKCDKKNVIVTKPDTIIDLKPFEIKNHIEERKLNLKQALDLENFTEKTRIVKNLINSYCHPTNVKLIKETLLKQ